jgi:ABC-2 type transport system permease protein
MEMLWYKAWRESGTRFVLSAIALTLLCLIIVFSQKENRGASEGISFAEYIWIFTYSTYAKDLFLVATLLLGFGGLLREATTGTAGFTLALPVLRSELVAVRVTVGLLQMAGLALLPALVVPALSHFVHESYPLLQAWEFSLLWIGCGSIVFATGFLLSIFLRGEYTGAVACFAVLIGYFAIMNLPSIGDLPFANLDRVMSGDEMPYFRESTHQLIGPLPWTPLLVIISIALGMLVIADRVVQHQDF